MRRRLQRRSPVVGLMLRILAGWRQGGGWSMSLMSLTWSATSLHSLAMQLAVIITSIKKGCGKFRRAAAIMSCKSPLPQSNDVSSSMSPNDSVDLSIKDEEIKWSDQESKISG